MFLKLHALFSFKVKAVQIGFGYKQVVYHGV